MELRLEQLESGATLRIVSDHDPRTVRYGLEDTHPGCFTWTYVESGPITWRVDILKAHGFEPFEDEDLLADSPRLRIFQIRVRGGAKERVLSFADSAALIFDRGAGMLEESGRRRAIAAGTVEIVSAGETCTVSAATDLHAYVAIAKETR